MHRNAALQKAASYEHRGCRRTVHARCGTFLMFPEILKTTMGELLHRSHTASAPWQQIVVKHR